MTDDCFLRVTIREALDNSLVKGFDPRNARDAQYLAEDLVELDADLENFDPSTLVPFVQEWLCDHRAPTGVSSTLRKS